MKPMIDQLREQRDELLTALEAVLEHVYCQNDYTARDYEKYYASVGLAYAAITKAKGSKWKAS
jgi:hypothetical protein